MYIYVYIYYVYMYHICTYSMLQIKASQQSITANLWPLTAHIYHTVIIVTSGFHGNFIIIMFNVMYHRDEILVSLVFAVRADIN